MIICHLIRSHNHEHVNSYWNFTSLSQKLSIPHLTLLQILTNAWSKLIRMTVSVSITSAVIDVCVLLEDPEPKQVGDMHIKNVILLRRFIELFFPSFLLKYGWAHARYSWSNKYISSSINRALHMQEHVWCLCDGNSGWVKFHLENF